MKKFIFHFFLVTCSLSLFSMMPLSHIHAAYVLPYPSFMPGNTLYKVSRLFDEVEKIWSFGTIASLKYSINQADKALVEGKTLFEYSQFKLGTEAIARSDSFVRLLPSFIRKGVGEGKDMTELVNRINDQMVKHQEVLLLMKTQIPSSVSWNEERESPVSLSLSSTVSESITIRSQVISDLNASNK